MGERVDGRGLAWWDETSRLPFSASTSFLFFFLFASTHALGLLIITIFTISTEDATGDIADERYWYCLP